MGSFLALFLLNCRQAAGALSQVLGLGLMHQSKLALLWLQKPTIGLSKHGQMGSAVMVLSVRSQTVNIAHIWCHVARLLCALFFRSI